MARQCALLGLPRSSYYYRPATESPENLGLMRMMDEEHTDHPFLGVRGMTLFLNRTDGGVWNTKRVRRLMRLMGLEAIYPKPHLSQPGAGHTIHPYLLRDVEIVRPNQAWCSDITYIPMRSGFMYLVAVMDWYSRRVLAWELSNTLEAGFCTDALDAAFAAFGTPEIFNTDQGSQFTGAAFVAGWRPRRAPQHGRATPRPRQRLHRAPLAQRQIRGRLPPLLRERGHALARAQDLLRLLQPPPAPPGPRRAHPERGLR